VSVRRRRPLPEPVARAARRLQQAEATVALLDRARPLNLTSERQRLAAAYAAGQKPRPAFTYAPRARLGDLRRELAELEPELRAGDVEAQLLSERAAELELEASLAEAVGTPGFAALAGRRFPLPEQPPQLAELAGIFSPVPAAAPPARLHRSDDAADPESLLSLLSRRIFAERLPIRVELSPGLATLAAVADGVVRVRANAQLSAAVSRRIALHEIEGHLLPRLAGQKLGGVFSAATCRASEDEEGRALLLEERAGFLDAARRSEIGRRYLAAASVRGGADLWETVELLSARGAEPDAALELACRAHRGGGLGRELVYWVGYTRVTRAFAAEPELEQLLRHGRVSIAAARALLADSIELDDDRDVI
jgi:hypothetical protein